jgi:uncharacterized protein (DUF488 family)
MARAGRQVRHAGAKRAAAASAPQAERTTPKGEASPVVYTVGHSTRGLEEFVGLLQAHGVQRLIDVRTVPRSRHNPQFNRDTLPADLERAGIGYRHMGGLGGLRKTRPDSVNRGWRTLSFRGYADYMQTEEFAQNVRELAQAAADEQVAIMCAEAVPWRCHRSLVGDALLVRGLGVEEIVDAKRRQPHRLTPFASVQGGSITYPAPDEARQTDLFPASQGEPRRRDPDSTSDP